ncbi:WW domain-binding protein 1-like isoform X1 [Anguilla rostrata]|uniref:WW domain-binding protein 1-like isoform X1 n=2 Tax=Anguilla rostrata TaxID=7938 RepID=UPI0030CEACFC
MTVSPQNTDMTTISQGVEFQSAGSLPLIGSPKYCPGVKGNGGGYLCETGHCCGETGCCTYYYELWWFWLLWTVLIMFSCCCAYRHRRAKLRIQQQQRQREINLIAYHGACNYPTSMLDLSFLASFKLPSYEEVAAQPSTPPPPYSSVFAVQGGGGLYAHAGPSGLTSSQSSDNYTSCSCESCSGTSPCSTSFSAQVTYETDTSNATTPSEASDFQPLGPAPAAGSPAPASESPAPASESPAPPAGSPTLPQPPPPPAPAPAPLPPPAPSAPALPLADPPADSTGEGGPRVDESPSPKPTLSPPKHALFSPNVDFFEPDGRSPCASDADEEDVDADESQYRHRRLTGDSGIEVCRCQVESEEEEEEEEAEKGEGAGRSKAQAEGEGPHALHDSADCSQARASETRVSEECAGLCGPAPSPAPGPAPLKEEAVITVESA